MLELSKDCPSFQDNDPPLFQSFLNILNNSYDSLIKRKGKDSHHRGLQIKISSFWDSQQSLFFISFEDNGIGFSKEDEHSLFIKGQSHKDNHEGLGLHKTKEVIESLGGRIVLNSPGENLGASLIISLPKKIEKV